MAYKNYAQVKAIQEKYKKQIKNICPRIDDGPGIYFLTRTDEEGINYFYIGQAVKLLSRMASHMTGYQHIDLSLKKRGWYSEENPYGWKLNFKHYSQKDLDDMEQYWILQYTKQGYQARYNKTSGSQGKGKEKINEFRPARGYYDGIRQGKITLARQLTDIIQKHLSIRIKAEKENNKISQKAEKKFYELLDENTYKEIQE